MCCIKKGMVRATRNPEEAGEILGNSPNLLIAKLDITDDEQVQSAVKAAPDRFGRIDAPVKNAGCALLSFFKEGSEKLIRQKIETNAFGTMNVTRAVLPFMRSQRSGLVIVLRSASGIRAVGGPSIYSASKSALEGWAEGMSADLKPFGIRCMLVEPGPFRTDFADSDTSLAFSDLEIDDYADTGGGSSGPDMARLAGLIRAHTPYDGRFGLPIPGVYTIRASRTNTELVHVFQQAALCIIVQGAKRVMLVFKRFFSRSTVSFAGASHMSASCAIVIAEAVTLSGMGFSSMPSR
jgi:NADP-dependent 3-hydroxy acid dehydrogenase YdfG